MTAIYLGIDVGGTATRWVAVNGEGDEIARGSAGGATGHLFNPDERTKLKSVLETIAGTLGADLRPRALSIGLTGYGVQVRDALRALVREVFGLTDEAIALDDDIALAYRAVFAPGEGHLISAGTGSIGLHLQRDGTPIRVGGRGILIDDGGSGSWIALKALDRLYRLFDETGGFDQASLLAETVFSAIGGDNWDATRAFVYGGDRGRIGTLAQSVAEAGAKGDPVAAGIIEEAGVELARLARALISRTTQLPVAIVGGIPRLHGIKPEIERALSDLEVYFPQIDAALSAAQRAATAAHKQENR
ncbi:N-acetylglucosamine kinase [Devosia pacifica]|uniref:N-acetylglucosamine kinase n=1 Tax=Devosia pacifica TaxID=1335967 RepID=A0A918SEC9_9HYPH|nr:BadF/BadG/BcrA/BcrD ATPase family protein [Devosia pacifica]GHA34746.1 N-acetylglucosamine kinase [Devosia pacifica]